MHHTINIQSYIDVITNSSTEVWQIATEQSVTMIKDVFNAVLEYAGSRDTADDLFDFELRSDSVLIIPKYKDDGNAEIFLRVNQINDLFEHDGEYNG